MIFKKKKLVVTHNGKYHADDIFAVATLQLALGKDIRLVRTRDKKKIAEAEYVVDVGHIYNPTENRFDHHQEGGAGARENSISYAAFGLVWKKFGEKVSGSKEVADHIDEKLVTPLDAHDNGTSITKPLFEDVSEYTINSFFASFLPTWKDQGGDFDKVFMKLLPIARALLLREIERAKSKIEARNIVMSVYEKMTDKRVLVLDRYYPWQDVPRQCLDLLFVVYPETTENTWRVSGVKKDDRSFELRRSLPKEWGGKDGIDLQKVVGVNDAVFCHKGLFLAGAKSKEGVLKMVELALR